MTKSLAGVLLSLVVGGLAFVGGSPLSAQMGPGQMGPGMMGGGQPLSMPMPQMAEVVKRMAERLASGKGIDADRAERLRRLADQLVAAAGGMSQGAGGGMMGGGMMSGGMMGEQMGEVSQILTQMGDLLRGP